MNQRGLILFLALAIPLASFADEPDCRTLYSRLARTYQTARKPFDYLTNQVNPFYGRNWHFLKEPGVIPKVTSFFKDLLIPTGHTLLPGVSSWLKTPTGKIFSKLWWDVKYQPTPHEWEILKKYGMDQHYRDRQAFLQRHPLWATLRRAGDVGIGSLFKAFWAAAIYWTYLEANSTPTPIVTFHDFSTDSQYEPEEDEVQLLIETTPFPHTALRIGNRVYSYGVSHLHVSSVAEYFLRTELEEAEEDRQRLGGDNGGPNSHEASLKGAKKVGAEKLPRAVRVITIKLTKEKVANIRDELELSKGKRYDNQTLVNDCSTMACRKLGIQNIVTDPAPSLLGGQLAIEKLLGNHAIGKTYLVMKDKPQSETGVRVRNALISVNEAALHTRLYPINGLRRLLLDWEVEKPEDLERFDPQILAEIASWKEEEALALKKDSEIQVIALRTEKLAKMQVSPEQKQRLKGMLVSSLQKAVDRLKTEAQKDLNSERRTLNSYHRARFRLELLEPLSQKMLKDIEDAAK